MDDAQLAAKLAEDTAAMTNEDRAALVEAIFDAFRDRGESSEDVAEAASISLELVVAGDRQALQGLLTYAQASPGLLKRVMAHA